MLIEPTWKMAGQVIFNNGVRRYFRYNAIDLNTIGASEIAKDKDYANFFMKKMGYPIVPKSKTFFAKRWGEAIGVTDCGIDAAYRYA